jgi:hypothetical protein
MQRFNKVVSKIINKKPRACMHPNTIQNSSIEEKKELFELRVLSYYA